MVEMQQFQGKFADNSVQSRYQRFSGCRLGRNLRLVVHLVTYKDKVFKKQVQYGIEINDVINTTL